MDILQITNDIFFENQTFDSNMQNSTALNEPTYSPRFFTGKKPAKHGGNYKLGLETDQLLESSSSDSHALNYTELNI